MRGLQICCMVIMFVAVKAGYISYPIYGGHSGYSHSGYEYKSYGGPSEHYAYPKYSYDYSVNDPHTGDFKTKWETRDGDVVKGR
ncbi:jg18581 [Pararge aegeria aegeria]|uniref:Jg18581 protein n=1 Tax=Pararge aegeria aegeria TaxID=348720 RepID=A0A8S4R3F2_9NEOP|nr:jg18581 [Pararge aegeria aegeria]